MPELTYEVELKFPLADPGPVVGLLAAWGVQPEQPLMQCDQYFGHPLRDFAKTDEAFRIRSVGEINFATYKGPVVDSQTKSRREIEVGLECGAAAALQFGEMLVMLGFRPVGTVRKKRVAYRFPWEGRNYEVALDDVESLGAFVEIETLADESQRNDARDGILNLAHRLGLPGTSERRSYLEMTLSSKP